MRAVEKRSEGWYVVKRDGTFGGYSTTSAVTERRRIPVEKNAPRELAVFVARQMGMLDKEDKQ